MLKTLNIHFQIPTEFAGETVAVPNDWDTWTEAQKATFLSKYVQSNFLRKIQVTSFEEV